MQVNWIHKALFVILLLSCSTPWIGTAMALVMGTLFSLSLGNPWPQKTARYSKMLLQVSVAGLGFGQGLNEVVEAGKNSIWFSLIGIVCTLILGYILGRFLCTDRNTSALISFGTAICGGSAIAAMAPVLKAKNEETAVALATVFTLNAAALLLFPLIGHRLQLDQNTFGAWCGLAIHDTSSVVGAASAYGTAALAMGATVKLSRAIWIAPLVMVTSRIKGGNEKARVPLFIAGFIATAAIRTLVPSYGYYWNALAAMAKQCLVMTLFLVGAGLTREVLRKVGIRPLLQAVILWGLVSGLTLVALQLFGLV